MELKSLFLGILFTVGIFAVKSAFGLRYYLCSCESPMKKAMVYTGFIVSYALVFSLSLFLVDNMKIISWFPLFQAILKYAMVLHFILAALLLVWGLLLLKSGKKEGAKSLGWLPLAVPCPVCVIVIFLLVAFFTAYFPENSSLSVLSVFAGFTGLNFATVLLVHFWEKHSGQSPENILGTVMLLIASYFVLSVIIMPQFATLEDVYRLSLYTSKKTGGFMPAQGVVAFVSLCLFSWGLSMSIRKSRSPEMAIPKSSKEKN